MLTNNYTEFNAPFSDTFMAYFNTTLQHDFTMPAENFRRQLAGWYSKICATKYGHRHKERQCFDKSS